MDEKIKESMLKIIADKKLKSASQSGMQRGPGSMGNTRNAIKKFKKGGVFDK